MTTVNFNKASEIQNRIQEIDRVMNMCDSVLKIEASTRNKEGFQIKEGMAQKIAKEIKLELLVEKKKLEQDFKSL